MADYEPCDTIEEFLRSKGAVDLLALLHERPRTYSEIESEIEITSSTITNRRDDAADLGLLTVEVASDDHGTKKVYVLTDLGEFLADRMARQGLLASYRKMRTLQQLVEEETEEVIDWVRQNPSQLLAFPEAEQGILDLTRPQKSSDTEKADESDDDTGNDEEDTENESSSARVIRPSDRIPDDAGESHENESQGTFADIEGDSEPEQSGGDRTGS